MRSLSWKLLLAAAATSGTLSGVAACGQNVSIADPKLNHCDRGDVVCEDHHAFSLSALESGAVQLPIDGNEARDFVLINDTGAALSTLRFTYFGSLAPESHLRCQVNGTEHKVFQTCAVSSALDPSSAESAPGASVTAPAEFTFIAGRQQTGIPAGAYFDIRAVGFTHGGQDRGYLSGDAQIAASSCTAAQSQTTSTTTSKPGHSRTQIQPSTPAICWPTPASIVYGTPLSTAQLDATASVPGSFLYSPGSGAILNPGVQTLTASFTPSDTATYLSTVATRSLTVLEASQTNLAATASPDPSHPVLLTVNVTTVPGGQPAPGSVTIFDTTNWVQAAVPLVNGTATWAVPADLTYLTVYAVYSGEGSVAPSTSIMLNGPDVMAKLYPAP